MLFGRKKPITWGETIRVSLWPRRSWARSAKYVSKRVLRLTASPHAISAGVAAGVFASFTPLLGLHFLIAFVVAYIIAGNFLAAASGTFFGNPITFPFIWASTYNLGSFVLSGEAPDEDSEVPPELEGMSLFENGFSGIWDAIIGIWDPVIKPIDDWRHSTGNLLWHYWLYSNPLGSRYFPRSQKKTNCKKNS